MPLLYGHTGAYDGSDVVCFVQEPGCRVHRVVEDIGHSTSPTAGTFRPSTASSGATRPSADSKDGHVGNKTRLDRGDVRGGDEALLISTYGLQHPGPTARVPARTARRRGEARALVHDVRTSSALPPSLIASTMLRHWPRDAYVPAAIPFSRTRRSSRCGPAMVNPAATSRSRPPSTVRANASSSAEPSEVEIYGRRISESQGPLRRQSGLDGSGRRFRPAQPRSPDDAPVCIVRSREAGYPNSRAPQGWSGRRGPTLSRWLR